MKSVRRLGCASWLPTHVEGDEWGSRMSEVQAPARVDQVTPVYTRAALRDYGFEVGEFSYGVPVVRRWDDKIKLTIGKYCSFADGVEIFLGGNHRPDWVSTYPFSAIAQWPDAAGIPGHPASKGDVTIGNDVWIGAQATILSGVTIGDGAVIGARSVVARDVAAYELVVGNPARLIRKRFSDALIDQLLKVRWWDWDPERVRQFLPLLMQGDIAKFLEAAGRHDVQSRTR
jgi:acetyltransferase-like isoleucine patch superfamily enzyme